LARNDMNRTPFFITLLETDNPKLEIRDGVRRNWEFKVSEFRFSNFEFRNSGEVSLRHVEKFQGKVVHRGSEFFDALQEIIVADHRRDGGEKACGGGDERF